MTECVSVVPVGDLEAAQAECQLEDRTPGHSAWRCRQRSLLWAHFWTTLADTTSVVLPAWRSGTTNASVRLGVSSVLQKRRSGSIFLVLLLGSRYRRSLDLLWPAPSPPVPSLGPRITLFWGPGGQTQNLINTAVLAKWTVRSEPP